MADLGKNSLWGDIKKKAGNVETTIMGPSYSYSDNVPTPSSLGVGSDGTFSQLGTNLSGVGTYVSTLIGSRKMGNQYYVNTGGTCTAPNGSLQPRYNYINNESAGLVFGVVEDIKGLNPLYLMNSLTASSSPACTCYQCPVSEGEQQYRFITPDLSPDFRKELCTVVNPSNCMPKTKEGFANDIIIPLVLAGVALTAILILRK